MIPAARSALPAPRPNDLWNMCKGVHALFQVRKMFSSTETTVFVVGQKAATHAPI
jgi:hypothetical protein